ncbi:MAG: hypothetical protein FJW94_03605 [Actinobacteria bacterium]|nr:hypothetical protein [Actinomycetota bacterium]
MSPPDDGRRHEGDGHPIESSKEEFTPPATITCVDCGGTAHLISPPRPDHDAVTGYSLGDILAYRCADCLDRWDLEFD